MLLADPAVLILDEPTTSLDTEGTVLLISHQIKTLELADTVIVLEAANKDGVLTMDEKVATGVWK